MNRDLAAPEPEYAYLQVAAEIEDAIRTGQLPSGTRLRSERYLAEEFEVSYGTIRRATAVLREKGLLRSEHGRGTFVA